MKSLLKSILVAIPIGIISCSAGSSVGSLGSVGVNFNPGSAFAVGESVTVTATLTGAWNGRDGGVGIAVVKFVSKESDIAIFNPDQCVIKDATESNIASCSVQLNGASPGTTQIIVSATAQNTGATNIAVESVTITN